MNAAKKLQKVTSVDLFCGAGGTSTGLAEACKELKVGVELIAVNHWTIAVETHKKKHATRRRHFARLCWRIR